jgi:hypothetical protein
MFYVCLFRKVGFASVKVEVTFVSVQSVYVYGGVEVQLHAFVTLVLDGRECQALNIGCISPLPPPATRK